MTTLDDPEEMQTFHYIIKENLRYVNGCVGFIDGLSIERLSPVWKKHVHRRLPDIVISEHCLERDVPVHWTVPTNTEVFLRSL